MKKNYGVENVKKMAIGGLYKPQAKYIETKQATTDSRQIT